MTRIRALFLFIFLISFCGPASAHLLPNSEIKLRFAPGVLHADATIPAQEYRYATGRPITDLGAIRTYLMSHSSALTPKGRPWAAKIDRLHIDRDRNGSVIVATLTFTPPPNESDRRLTLVWDAVIRETDTHFALVTLASDLAGAKTDGELIGSFSAGQRSIKIDRGAARGSSLFINAIRIGMRHIIEGVDHLSFLITLILVAPLSFRNRRWAERRASRQSILALAKIVTAFTLGHSLTLILVSLWAFSLPVAPVEIAVAASVFLAAIHALRPIFAKHEPLVAASFGLIHGSAFATAVSEFGDASGANILVILGFNIGIELVQLMLVGLLLPVVLIGSKYSWYQWLRRVVAIGVAIAAILWIMERSAGLAGGPSGTPAHASPAYAR